MSVSEELPPADDEARIRFDKEIADLDLIIAKQNEVRKFAKKSIVRKSELMQPWSLFIRRMCLLNAQSWGSRVQNYLASFYDWKAVAQSLDKGDVTLSDGQYCEVKVTIITASNAEANFVQLRQHQQIAGYRLFVIDSNYKVFRFDLTKAQMAIEITKVGQSAHGTKGAVVKNLSKEESVRFPWDRENETKTRWISNYHIKAPQEVTPDHMDFYKYENAKTLRIKTSLAGLP